MEPLIRTEIDRHYSELYDESERLAANSFNRLEFIRTKELILRFLADQLTSVIDIGGGPGAYALWLSELGHDVTLIDPVARHVEQARISGVSRAQVGEAGFLDFKDQAFDHALLLGPLYHLQQHTERLAALTEARRVLKPGGFLFAAGITRFASAIDGLYNGTIDDPAFGQIVTVDLATGRHSNTTGNPKYFTTAYFHRPDELASELSAAGFQNVELFAVEGVSWAAPDLDDRVADPVKLAAMLDLLKRLESEPSILGASPHFLAVGRA